MKRMCLLALGLALGASEAAAEGPLRLLKDVNPSGPSTSAPFWFTEAGGHLYFTAFTLASGRELWVSDGTEEGTTVLKDIRPGLPSSLPKDLVALGGALLFTASDGVHGREWWTTDGTEEGTRLLKDIWPGASSGIAEGNEIGTPTILFQGYLYFRASDGSTGMELWRTDGTEDGTVLFKDIAPGAASGFPAAFAAEGDLLYFTASEADHGREIWSTDGEVSGTHLVADISPGPASSGAFALAFLGDRLLLSADDGVLGQELWVTDGRETGTHLVRDLRPGEEGGYPLNAVVLDGVAVFAAEDAEHGREMWRTDGTEAGTALLQDIWPGPDSSARHDAVSTGEAIYWSAEDPEHGAELWRSDGTVAGTARMEIVPGPASAFPSPMLALGEALLFNVNVGDGTPGTLWRVRGAEAPVPVQSTGIAVLGPGPSCLVGSRAYLAGYDPVHGTEPRTGRAAIVAGDAPRAIEDLAADVQALVPEGLAVGLVAKLEAAARLWRAGGMGAATRLLHAFEQEVRALTGRGIPAATAEKLLAFLEEIEALGEPRDTPVRVRSAGRPLPISMQPK